MWFEDKRSSILVKEYDGISLGRNDDIYKMLLKFVQFYY